VTDDPAADVWAWAPATEASGPVVTTLGYEAVGLDDGLGAIVGVSPRTDGGYLVVDAGGWHDAARVLVPAGAVRTIDHDAEQVEVGLKRTDLAKAPPFRDECDREAYRREATAHFAERIARRAEDG
jgi:hypothetical protein